MRELKFRIWSELWPEMVTTDSFQEPKNTNLFNRFESQYAVQGEYKSAIMQFTGLKDKDGNDIYEGDILEKYCDDLFDLDNEELIPTGIKDVCSLQIFGYWLKNELFGYEGEGLETPNEWKIIGNIYENQNLLTDVKA